MTRGGTVALVLGVVIVVSTLLGGCGGDADHAGRQAQMSLSVTGVYPDFNPAKPRYVSRCGRDGPAIRAVGGNGIKVAVGSGPGRTRALRIGTGTPPGEDFTFSVIGPGERRTYEVRCLPGDFPPWQFESLRRMRPGLFVVSFQSSPETRPWIIVFDHQGVPRWWYSPDTRALWAQILKDGSVEWARSFGDGYGLDPRMADEVRSLSGRLKRVVRTEGEIIDGHEFRELASGNVFVDTYAPGTKVDLGRFGGPRSASAVFAEIQEIDPLGRVIWRWNSRRHIGLGETGRWWRNVLSNPKPGRDDLATFDPVHINSIDHRGPNEVVISARHTDALYGIERSSGDILWKLGGTPTAESLRIVGDPAAKVFGGQHDARVAEDGTISVYDNGKNRPRRPRVVSYRLDLRKGTATYLGQLNDAEIKTSHCCGSARPLAGGGWLVSWGNNPLVTAFNDRGRVAFRLHLAASTFRAVPVPAGAASPADLDQAMEMMESGS